MAHISSFASFAEYCESKRTFPTTLRIDANGILRWKSNGYVPMPETIKWAFEFGFLTKEQADANYAAQKKQHDEIWAPIHSYVEEIRRRRDEAQAESLPEAVLAV